MAKGKKTGGRNFQAGKSGNPAGRKPDPLELKEARKYTRQEVELALHRELSRPYENETRDVDGEQTNLDRLIYKIVRVGIAEGDPKRLDFVLTQLFGKIPDQLEIRAKLEKELSSKSETELIAEAQLLIEAMKGEKK